jgi:protein gp37
MGDRSAIEWTEATWNPVVGCTRVSEGCRHCYAERDAIRISGPGQKYGGVVRSTPAGPRWTGVVRLVEAALDQPLRWTKPRRIFVNSMSDLFHEKVELEWIDRIFDVMGRAPQHTFQVLTKRPVSMRSYMRGRYRENNGWSLPNIWLGVSVEDQATADERIPLLLQTPAALRWVSYEPALAPVMFGGAGPTWLGKRSNGERGIDWLVVGGESGPGARPFDLTWARSTLAQGRAAGVRAFVKQLGSRPFDSQYGSGRYPVCRDRKGGDPTEWPEDLRVRDYPR